MQTLKTPYGEIEYTLTRKRVKNLNLRIRDTGEVMVSAPPRMSERYIEAFMQSKAHWITTTRQKLGQKPQRPPCRYTKAECLAVFTAVSDAIFPLFADILGGQKPQLKVREMKTRWGSCHISKRVITLNTRLAEMPSEAIEYVVLHEYVHFLHPDHQAGFHAEMARLMPDYKARRKLLRANI